jgi:hypothetical protein
MPIDPQALVLRSHFQVYLGTQQPWPGTEIPASGSLASSKASAVSRFCGGGTAHGQAGASRSAEPQFCWHRKARISRFFMGPIAIADGACLRQRNPCRDLVRGCGWDREGSCAVLSSIAARRRSDAGTRRANEDRRGRGAVRRPGRGTDTSPPRWSLGYEPPLSGARGGPPVQTARRPALRLHRLIQAFEVTNRGPNVKRWMGNLRAGSLAVVEIARDMPVSRPAVSKHPPTLRDLQPIGSRRRPWVGSSKWQRIASPRRPMREKVQSEPGFI